MARPAAAALAALLSLASPLHAAPRTFVASSGHDADPCTLAQPCRSFAGALSRTDAGGEIVALDSAGYGRVTIDRSVAIVAAPGVAAAIAEPSGDAVAIATPGIAVTLRGLALNGLGSGGRGVAVAAASRVSIERCTIAAFAGQGVAVEADGAIVRIADSMLYGHGNRGVAVTATATLDVDRVWVHDVHGPGIHVALGASASIARSSITANRRGITVFGDAGGLRTRLVVVDTTVAGNLFSGLWVRSLVGGGDGFVQATRVQVVGNGAEGVRVDAVDGSTGLASIERSTVAGNGLGVVDDGSAGAAVVVSGSTVAGNDGFGLAQAGGTLRSRGDNAVHGNNGGGAQSAGAITPIGPL